MQENDIFELDQEVDQAKTCKEVILVTRDYEKIIRSKKKAILDVEFRQGRTFKRFKPSVKL